MKKYIDPDHDSGISEFDYGDNWISVKFKSGRVFTYRAVNVGTAHIEKMKHLADTGDGLNAYINSNPAVKNSYDR